MTNQTNTELYDKKLVCPVCTNEYTSKKVKASRLRIEKKDSDLMTYYKGENPIVYSVAVCSKCGFSYLDSEIKKLKNHQKRTILDKIARKINNKNYGGLRSYKEAEEAYKLALYSGELIDSKKMYLASLTLRLAWIYRLKKDEKNELRFLKNTRELFEYSYENESLINSPFDTKTVEYLIGEIYRRFEERKNAVKWFNIVVSNNLGANRRIEKLAREQWQLTK